MSSPSYSAPTTPQRKPTAEARPLVIDTPTSRDSLHHAVDHDGNIKPANFRNVAQVELDIEGRLVRGTMKGVKNVVENVFHDLLLPVVPGSLLAHESLRHEEEWTKWPRTAESISEKGMAELINIIGEIVKNIARTTPRCCSDMFKDNAVPDPAGGPQYKPDNVLLQSFIAKANRWTVTWALILIALEIKSSQKKKAFLQVARYATSIFGDVVHGLSFASRNLRFSLSHPFCSHWSPPR